MNTNRRTAGFTLLELLVVIAIIGILASIAVPTMNSFKPNVTAAASRQLLDDVARARQLAMSQRTTVYMIFVPPEFWTDQIYGSLPPEERNKGRQLYDKQMVGYTFVALRGLGDQPGRSTPRYLGPWKTLPEGTFIPLQKFAPNNLYYNIATNGNLAFQVSGFTRTGQVPFPSADAPRVGPPARPYPLLPYIAFDYLGRLTTGRNELIPIVKGSILHRRDSETKVALEGMPSALEIPAGSSTNNFTLVHIDWLTGRGRIERQEVR